MSMTISYHNSLTPISKQHPKKESELFLGEIKNDSDLLLLILIALDGNAVVMVTIIVGLIPPFIRSAKKFFNKERPCFVREQAIADMLNGVMLVPFMMMTGSVFSSGLMTELVTSAKITVAIGGIAGLFFVIGEFFKKSELVCSLAGSQAPETLKEFFWADG
jgi:hypothetical protein